MLASDSEDASALPAKTASTAGCMMLVTKEAAYCWPPLTVARQPRAKLAEAAINLLLEPGGRSRHVQLSTELIRRASCGCPHADDVVEPRAHLLIRN